MNGIIEYNNVQQFVNERHIQRRVRICLYLSRSFDVTSKDKSHDYQPSRFLTCPYTMCTYNARFCLSLTF